MLRFILSMPIIEGADMTSISTEFKPYVEGEYRMLIKSTEMHKNNSQLRIVCEIEDAPNSDDIGKPFTDFINIVQNDGKLNQIGLATVKRYLEAVFGKDSPESNNADTDPLVGHSVTLYLIEDSYKDKDGKDRTNNKVKKILKA